MYLFANTQRSPFLRIILLAVLIGNYLFSYSQMPQWDWALQVHGNHEDPINLFDADNFGNTLIVGDIYSNAITIGDTQLLRTSKYQAGDGYIAVLNNEGDISWARQIYNLDNGLVQQVDFRSATFDAHGNILIAGWYYRGDLYIDTTILSGDDKISLGFVLKFDPDGNLIWSHLYEEGVNPNEIASDQKGGFYFLGRMTSICQAMDLGDTILVNIVDQEQAFIVHYNQENKADWAKLLIGYTYGIQGVSNENGDLCFWGEFHDDSYVLDSITLYNPHPYDDQDYFGICNNSGNILCARTISDEPHGFNSIIFTKDSVYIVGAFFDEFMIIEEDTLKEVPWGFETKFMSIFNYKGEYAYSSLFSSDFNYLYNISNGINNKLNFSTQISSAFWNGMDSMINVSGASDPAVIYLDSHLNNINGFSLPLIYDNSIPATMTDPFGNMIFISSIEGDTLIFGEDTLKNYQIQPHRDYYVARSNECNNSLFDISEINGFLMAIDGIAWQWYVNDTLINNEISQIFYPTYNGFYRARVSLENGCFAWSKPFNFLDSNVNNQDEINITVFPNPANDLVNILINEPFDKLTIYNAIGQQIASWGGADQLNTVFSYHTPGFYFAYVTKNEIQSCIKFVIL